MGRYSDVAKHAHSVTRTSDGTLSFAVPNAHGVDDHIYLNGAAANEATADLKSAGVAIHFLPHRRSF